MSTYIANRSGVIDDAYSSNAIEEEMKEMEIAQQFFNRYADKDYFEAICISGATQAEQVADPSGSMNTFYPIKLRVEDIHSRFYPDPCGKEYADESKTQAAKKIIGLHTTAWSNAPLGGGQRTPGFGETVRCKFTTKGPQNVGLVAFMRGLRYEYPKQSTTYNYECANATLQSLVGQFIVGPELMPAMGAVDGTPASVPQFDAKDIPSKDYNTQLVPAVPYKENRVTLKHFGSMPCSSPQIVDVGAPSSKRAHVLVVKRFKLLQEAFIKETGLEPLKVTSACRPHRWASRAAYEAKMIKSYGSVAEGRKWVAFASPHESGLALDMTHPAKPRLEVSSKAAKAGRLQKSPAFLWLKANAHRWGFTPYKREPWHWELKVPYESWRTGEEFVTDGNYAVRVIETKK